jgi:curli biogenesis system outer membrane secretion channel CsgG
VGAEGLERCDTPLGLVAVADPRDDMVRVLWSYRLQSPVQLIRLMVQQSNCFTVVERGVGAEYILREQSLRQANETGQAETAKMVAADYVLTPAVMFAEDNAGGLRGDLEGLLDRSNRLWGRVTGGVRFKEAQTSMLLADARTGIQVAAAEGSTRKADLNLTGRMFGRGTYGSLGGYGDTNEGKIVASALLDNYNKIVRVVRSMGATQRTSGVTNPTPVPAAVAAVDIGDVVRPRLANVRLLKWPDAAADIVTTLPRTEELVVTAINRNGFIAVRGVRSYGWVERELVARSP